MTQELNTPHITFIGFGEAGMAFASGWRDAAIAAEVSAYDIKSGNPDTAALMERRYAEHSVAGYASVDSALNGAQAVFSVVTADQAFVAAQTSAEFLGEGALWFDCNSCAPQSKVRAAQLIESVGGRYVDVAVMAPVHPKRHEVPLLIAGPHVDAANEVLEGLGMKPRVAGNTVGQASSVKMLRSVMIKGLEALTAECFLAARRAGVEDQVIGSLEASDPDIRWRDRATYNLERMMVHGTRRAAEMREVALTVDGLGLPNGLSAATAVWQDHIASLDLDPGTAELMARLDRVLDASKK